MRVCGLVCRSARSRDSALQRQRQYHRTICHPVFVSSSTVRPTLLHLGTNLQLQQFDWLSTLGLASLWATGKGTPHTGNKTSDNPLLPP